MNAAEKLLDVSHLMKGGVHEKIIINKIGLKPLMLGSILCFFLIALSRFFVMGLPILLAVIGAFAYGSIKCKI
ncbi:MAG: hypothetical protein HFI20_09465 [Lachnospiraceae bacterium]|nr:hypothetical protein [Lachnospiraceae bacterium]MCI9306136.1 hypothetical protein [Lachnospiraceae bacterium]